MPRSRRTLLKSTGRALGGGTLASIAGCLSDSWTASDNSADEPATSNQSRGTAVTEFTQWLPDPTTTPLRDGYGFRCFDITGIRDHRDSIHGDAYSRLKTQMLHPVPSEYVDVTAVDASLQIDHVMQLALGSFDPEAFGEKLTGDRRSSTRESTRRSSTRESTQSPTTATRTPWQEPERYQGFDLYGTESVYAVSEDVLMVVSPMLDADAVEYAKAIIDAPAAKTSQYADGNEYVASMIGVVDDVHALWCYPEAMDGSTARGFRKDSITGELQSWRFGTETTHLTFANTYPDAETAESGELKEYIESESNRFGPYDGLDVETEGRLAWTDGTIPTKEFDHLSAGGPGDSVHTTH